MQSSNLYSDKKLDEWTIYTMKKIGGRKANQTTVRKIIHDAVRKTFLELYRLERESGDSFYYLF